MAVIYIKEINKEFKTKQELIEYVITQNKALTYATDKIRELESNKELQVNTSVTTMVKSIPEAICQLEIDRLMAKALTTPLDFEETKKLDILIKNYYLAKDKEGPKSEEKPKLKDIVITDEALTEMASKRIKHE